MLEGGKVPSVDETGDHAIVIFLRTDLTKKYKSDKSCFRTRPGIPFDGGIYI